MTFLLMRRRVLEAFGSDSGGGIRSGLVIVV